MLAFSGDEAYPQYTFAPCDTKREQMDFPIVLVPPLTKTLCIKPPWRGTVRVSCSADTYSGSPSLPTGMSQYHREDTLLWHRVPILYPSATGFLDNIPHEQG